MYIYIISSVNYKLKEEYISMKTVGETGFAQNYLEANRMLDSVLKDGATIAKNK